jgi:hypothetical protein
LENLPSNNYINKFDNGADTDLRIYQEWDEVPWRSRHPLLNANNILINLFCNM